MTTNATIMATPATTPTTTPAIAPPDSAVLEEPLSALSAEAAADSVGVAVAEADVGDADEDVDVDVADVDDVETTVVDWSSLIISRSSFTSKAEKSSLALFLHAPHEYPALESHLVSRYIETQRLLPSGSQENGLSLPRGEFVQFCAFWPRAISVSSVALV